MKKLLLITALTILSGRIFAQVPQTRTTTRASLPPPLTTREVSGIVKDETGETVIGATITLTSKKDTLRTATNEDGIFVLKDVKLATFVVTIQGIGYETSTRRYLNNDAIKRIVLDPVVLKAKNNQLKEVTINGTPSIVYKTDTVEYRASDYKVRENATVDELLKKMEGMEVGSDGSLTHQGQQVMKAKLNGKDYAGGNLAQAIQNLPADIVEKIQVVDDYGDQAARTGIKDGDPQKVLNITTKADRSVGTTGRLTAQAGNDDRYNAQLFLQRINANQQLGLIGNFRNTVNGIASSGIQGGATNGGGGGTGVGAGARGGSSPGTTQSGSPSFNYRDQWSKKIQVVSSYVYNFSNNNAINDRYGNKAAVNIGRNTFTSNGTSQSNNKSHRVNFELDYTIDSANYLQISPSYSYSNSNSSNTSRSENTTYYVDEFGNAAGFEHLKQEGNNSSLSGSANYGLNALYLHMFKKSKRNLSVQVNISQSTSKANGGTNAIYHNYLDSTTNSVPVDSVSNLITNRSNKNTSLQTTISYVEPLSELSRLEFSGNVRNSSNNSRFIQERLDPLTGQLQQVANLSKIYNYSTAEERLTFSYRYNGTKVNLTLGATAIPYSLNGTKLNNSTGMNVPSSNTDFRIIPAFRFAYIWSRTERFQLTYAGSNQEPNFTAIQPFTDSTDTRNIVFGNPDLKPAFTNSVSASYNNYLPNSKFNFSFNINLSSTKNAITTNTISLISTVPNPADPAKPVQKSRNDIHYINLSGAHAVVGRYNIAKQLDDRRYNLSLNGNISYQYSPIMSDGKLNHTTIWRFDERFGPRITPNDDIEINPYIAYDLSRSFTTVSRSANAYIPPAQVTTLSLAIDGKMYFLKTFMINYAARKAFVNGIPGFNTNPLVIDAGFEKKFLKKQNLVLTFNVYDILHQNNYIEQTRDDLGSVTNTLSNTLSRYFLVGVRLNLQKWSGRPQRNGRDMQRRGDGSFIY